MEIKVQGAGAGSGITVTMACPSCGHTGVFERTPANDLHVQGYWLGQRKCPNPACNGHIFYVMSDDKNEFFTYPPRRIEFDTSNIPERIVNTFKEAITCHAQRCHTSAGIMIRRTLEELCEEKEVKGRSLKERITALQGKLVIPQELLDAMDELRLLGNDAAHIESKEYDDIGNDEIEAAIELTKEILKAIYQMQDLVNKLKALKLKRGN
ncbi:MAG: DUF4145 domain-containing protein [Desulfuromonadales bacterium]|nr:DUF4145 domain-containing protein [Desulfuromonadales bacterium]